MLSAVVAAVSWLEINGVSRPSSLQRARAHLLLGPWCALGAPLRKMSPRKSTRLPAENASLPSVAELEEPPPEVLSAGATRGSHRHHHHHPLQQQLPPPPPVIIVQNQRVIYPGQMQAVTNVPVPTGAGGGAPMRGASNGSATPNVVIREQYWVYRWPSSLRCSGWSKRERILFVVLVTLGTAVLALVVVLVAIARAKKEDGDGPSPMHALLGKHC